ncbi:hypothetical protein [Kineococcus sp. R86509]|uniref:hypothetical protein n=1 Tax=Kineococcus sp. R86509 TaxID=3093851 RepID=UPI0036D2AE6F
MTDAGLLKDAETELKKAKNSSTHADPERLSSLAVEVESLDPELAGRLRVSAQQVRALRAKHEREQSRVLKPKFRAGGLDRF